MRQWSTMKKLIWLRFLQAASAILKTVTGTAPLSLTNAVASTMHSLTQTGKCAQASTPTPSDPVDIYCNNGALRMVDDELPSGYKRVLGYSCNDNAMWQITDFKLRGSDTVRISFSVAAACNVFGCYQGTSATDNYDLYASITSGSKYFRYGSGTYLSYFSNDNLNKRFDVVYTPTGSQGMPDDSTWSALTFESANDLLLGSTTITGTSAKLKGKLFGDFIVENGNTERLHLVPCERVSDNVLGYYDLVGEAFYEPYSGFAGAVSLGYDGSHYSLQTVGTPEVLTVQGKNMNVGTIENKGYSSTGEESASATFAGTLCKIPCTAGQKFTVSWGGFTDGVSGVFISTWKTDGTWNTRQAIAANTTLTYTIGAGVGIVNFTLYKTGGVTIGEDAWMQVEYGDTATAYEPPVSPQTASAENLYAVGTYADTQEVISGAVNRQCGVKVLTGNENISVSNACYVLSVGQRKVGKLEVGCSHFQYSTQTSAATADGTVITFSSANIGFRYDACADKNAFAAWLAAQYAAGTPVIVVYPLAEGTTETVTAQPIATSEGTNVVSVIAEVSDIALEAQYYATE